ncbi:MAG: hypothetical protein SGCHY_004401 [Lobulomycetales sp.]
MISTFHAEPVAVAQLLLPCRGSGSSTLMHSPGTLIRGSSTRLPGFADAAKTRVKICGIVTLASESTRYSLVHVNDPSGTIACVVWKNSSGNISIPALGSLVSIQGRPDIQFDAPVVNVHSLRVESDPMVESLHLMTVIDIHTNSIDPISHLESANIPLHSTLQTTAKSYTADAGISGPKTPLSLQISSLCSLVESSTTDTPLKPLLQKFDELFQTYLMEHHEGVFILWSDVLVDTTFVPLVDALARVKASTADTPDIPEAQVGRRIMGNPSKRLKVANQAESCLKEAAEDSFSGLSAEKSGKCSDALVEKGSRSSPEKSGKISDTVVEKRNCDTVNRTKEDASKDAKAKEHATKAKEEAAEREHARTVFWQAAFARFTRNGWYTCRLDSRACRVYESDAEIDEYSIIKDAQVRRVSLEIISLAPSSGGRDGGTGADGDVLGGISMDEIVLRVRATRGLSNVGKQRVEAVVASLVDSSLVHDDGHGLFALI